MIRDRVGHSLDICSKSQTVIIFLLKYDRENEVKKKKKVLDKKLALGPLFFVRLWSKSQVWLAAFYAQRLKTSIVPYMPSLCDEAEILGSHKFHRLMVMVPILKPIRLLLHNLVGEWGAGRTRVSLITKRMILHDKPTPMAGDIHDMDFTIFILYLLFNR